jgi:hypothetical protein
LGKAQHKQARVNSILTTCGRRTFNAKCGGAKMQNAAKLTQFEPNRATVNHYVPLIRN